MEGEPHPVRARFDISWQTIFKLLLGVLLAYVAIKLWPLFKLLAIAMLLAVPLYQIVRWATRKGWPRWVGLLLATTALVFCLAALVGLIGPMAFRQASALGKELPRIKEQVASQLPRSGPVADMLQTAFN